MKYIFIFSFFCLLAIDGTAQSKASKKEKNKTSANSRAASSVETGSESMIFMDSKTSAAKRKAAGKTTEDLKQEYRERMVANAKKYEKMAKEMEKPQYSDPSYFGHKNPPKKRKPGKKKFCKECRIRH